jgi:hypothetical protein
VEDLIFWLALVLFSLASQFLRRKPPAPQAVPRPRETRLPGSLEGRVVSRRAPAAGKPEPSPVAPVAPVTVMPSAPPSRACTPKLVLDRSSLAQAVVLSEILGNPRGLRPWRRQGWRR